MQNNHDILKCLKCANCDRSINVFQYDLVSHAYMHDCCTLFCCVECAQKYFDSTGLLYRPINYHDISFYQDCILIAYGVKDTLFGE